MTETAAITGEKALPAGFFILRHYLKDLSVENPGGRIADADAPGVGLGLDGRVTASPMATSDQHCVEVTIRLTAMLRERVVFLMELTYRIEVQLQAIATEKTPQTLCVEVPTQIYPNMQEVLMRNAAYSGYPEMQAGTLDFQRVYDSNISRHAIGGAAVH